MQYEKTSQYVKYLNCPTINIKTTLGYTLEGTFNHPVLDADKQFRQLQDLSIGDYLYIPLGYNLFPDNYQPLNKQISRRLYGKSLQMWQNTPDILNEDENI